MFVIRAPRLFASVYNLLKPMLDEGTRNKVFVLDDHYMDTLAKFIAPEHIPKGMGGTCVCDGDPNCRTKCVGSVCDQH